MEKDMKAFKGVGFADHHQQKFALNRGTNNLKQVDAQDDASCKISVISLSLP